MGIRRANRGIILALPNSTLKAVLTERLRQRGWHVWRAASHAELRRLATMHFPAVAVLAAEGCEESGWLTCAKLLRAQPHMRIFLIGDDDPLAESLAGWHLRLELVLADLRESKPDGLVEGAAVLI